VPLGGTAYIEMTPVSSEGSCYLSGETFELLEPGVEIVGYTGPYHNEDLEVNSDGTGYVDPPSDTEYFCGVMFTVLESENEEDDEIVLTFRDGGLEEDEIFLAVTVTVDAAESDSDESAISCEMEQAYLLVKVPAEAVKDDIYTVLVADTGHCDSSDFEADCDSDSYITMEITVTQKQTSMVQ
jgi:hypothetical protein